MTTDTTAPTPTLGDDGLPDRHHVQFTAPAGEKPTVLIDGREVQDHLHGIQIVADALSGTRVALEVPPHRLDEVCFDGIARVTIDQYADDPGPAAAVFLSAIDAGELEKAALNRLDLGAEEHATTAAILRQLVEWANGEGGVS